MLSLKESNLVETLQDMLDVKILDKEYVSTEEIPKMCILLQDTDKKVDTQLLAQLNAIIPTFSVDFTYEQTQTELVDIWSEFEMELQISRTLNLNSNALNPLIMENLKKSTSIGKSAISNMKKFLNAHLVPLVYNNIEEKIKAYEKDVASTKRGLSNRFFKVSLKYFSTSKQNSQAQDGPIIDPTTQKLIFPHFSSVMTLRRLGDFAFMTRDFKYAQSIFLLLKKDVESNEKFTKYHAGCQVMILIGNADIDIVIDQFWTVV